MDDIVLCSRTFKILSCVFLFCLLSCCGDEFVVWFFTLHFLIAAQIAQPNAIQMGWATWAV